VDRKIKKCPQCGHNNNWLSDVCANCSTSLENVAVVALDEEISKQSGVVGKDEAKAPDVAQRTAETFRLSSASAQLESMNPSGLRFTLSGTAVLGRGADIDLTCLPESTAISRRHSKVTLETGKWYIEDLDSANGTFVNGMKLQPNLRHEIESGTKIALGNVHFIFKVS
jgi:hypothetical protein